jgi:multiple sugar transport system permease protein
MRPLWTRPTVRPRARSSEWAGLAFASPWIVHLLLFIAYPIAVSLYYSFCDFDTLSPPHWVGSDNFRRLLTEDPLFWRSLRNTFYMVAFGLPLSMATSLTLAFLLNQKLRGMAFYRTVFYLPSIVPVVATSVLWLWLLNPEIGLVNAGLARLGLRGPGWLIDPAWAKPALILMGLWGAGGGMLIYLAGLQDVPESLYEAAALDGAGAWARLRHVTLPMLSPILLFNLIMGLIGAFQYFTQVYVMTNGSGGPQDATLFYALRLFHTAFRDFRMGYASAMAWVLFLITLLCALVVFRTSARWVYYAGESR